MKRKFQDYIFVIFKGMAMGAADVVPGVSGGTAAFITGIYSELIDSVKALNIASFKLLFSGKFQAFWKKINGGFLFAITLGIFLSVISLAKVMQELVERSPEPLWAFFFGIIAASVAVACRKIAKWDVVNLSALVSGALIAYLITVLMPSATPATYWFVFISGILTAGMMLLPGISAAFFLLLIGKYGYLLNAIASLKLDVLAVFVAGAGIGLVTFTNIMSWLLLRFRNATTAFLAGFMLGSLNKVWPWKETVSNFFNSHGTLQPLIQDNILPVHYMEITGKDPLFFLSSLLCIIGFLIIIVFDKVISEK